jgi:hypothetical protein
MQFFAKTIIAIQTENGLPHHFGRMRRARHAKRQRGTSVITKIVIAGFLSPVIVEKGKNIRDWKAGLRNRLKAESRTLAKLAQHMETSSQSVANDPYNEESFWEWVTTDGTEPET